MLAGITWPLAVNHIRRSSLSNTFGNVRKNADGTTRPHQGWDFEASVGTPVYAIADGKIEYWQNIGDYGLQVCMSFKAAGMPRFAFYAHLKDLIVKEGPVKMNTMLGWTGKSGNASKLPAIEDHLHFEVRTQAKLGKGLDGRVSPLTIFEVCPLESAVHG